MQRIVADWAAAYLYVDIPIKATKKSKDPASPLWIEIDVKKMSDLNEMIEGNSSGSPNRVYIIPDRVKFSVPQGVLVDKTGNIRVIFDKDSTGHMEYSFTVQDVLRCQNRAQRNPPTPDIPNIETIDKTSIVLSWALPQPVGVVHSVELQHAIISSTEFKQLSAKMSPSKRTTLKKGEKPVEKEDDGFKWSIEATKRYEYLGIRGHKIDKLQPGSQHIFKIRYKDFMGWSDFSIITSVITTLPDVPTQVRGLKSVAVYPDAVHLEWNRAGSNGSDILYYIVNARSIGDSFVELYRGLDCHYLAVQLFPDNAYSFEVIAVNEIGDSPTSDRFSIKTPPRKNRGAKAVLDDDLQKMADTCVDAWNEYWDNKTMRTFYFNRITGQRTLDRPDILGPLIDYGPESPTKSPDRRRSRNRLESKEIENAESDDKDAVQKPLTEKQKEMIFRKKRYKLLRGIHVQKKRTSELHIDTGDTPSLPFSSKGSVLEMQIRRDNLLYDAFRAFIKCDIENLHKRTRIYFKGEEGIDSGGPSKEFFLLFSENLGNFGDTKGFLRKASANNGFFFSEPSVPQPPPKPSISKLSSQGQQGVSAVFVGAVPAKIREIQLRQQQRLKEEAELLEANNGDTGNGTAVVAAAVSSSKEIISVAATPNCSPTDFAGVLGKLLGKSVYDRQLLNFPLSDALLNAMMGYPEPIATDTQKNSGGGKVETENKSASLASSASNEVKDAAELGTNVHNSPVEEMKRLLLLDAQLHTSLKWMIENDITDVIDQCFCVASKQGQEIPLCRNGIDRVVTERNKFEYVKLRAEYETRYAVEKYVLPFMDAFHEVVPLETIKESGITAAELDAIINGKSSVDVEEIRAYSIYQGGISESHMQVLWFWQVLGSFDQFGRRAFLRFVTGTSKAPLDGYDPPFNITEGVDMLQDSLPRAHTCFNQVVLPPYSSPEMLKERLWFAIENCEGFELS